MSDFPAGYVGVLKYCSLEHVTRLDSEYSFAFFLPLYVALRLK